jgi:acyl-coenzyme A thioesterase PaaI-like protein
MLNLYPPLLAQRIRVVEIAPGFTAARVRVAKSLLTRNLFGTTFGGTIFAAADPIHAILYWQVFARRGRAVQAWLKSARIEYLRPAASALTLTFALGDGDVEDAAAALDAEGRFRRAFRTEAIDTQGQVCAVIETEVVLRLPRGAQKEVSAF